MEEEFFVSFLSASARDAALRDIPSIIVAADVRRLLILKG
jgi:hypothetical protein